MNSYVYVQSEPALWTVGFYDPAGKWHPDGDFSDRDKARDRVHYLNGGDLPPDPTEIAKRMILEYREEKGFKVYGTKFLNWLESREEEDIPCPVCGGKLIFDADDGSYACPRCDYYKPREDPEEEENA